MGLQSFVYAAGQIIRALSKEMMAKYEERVREEDLNLADIDGLVRYALTPLNLKNLEIQWLTIT